MLILDRNSTGNTITATFSERLAEYSIANELGATFYLKIINDLTQDSSLFTLIDVSLVPHRFNHFILDVDLSTYPLGQYTYKAYADSECTQELEIGRLLMSGASVDNIYS